MSQSIAKLSQELLAPQFDYILLDGSASMQDKWWETLDCIQAYVEVLKSENVNSHGRLHVFDSSDLEMVQRDAPLKDWATMRDDPPGSHFHSTPLYDAINLMARRMRDLNPERATIVIVTDGHDTGGGTDVTQAKALLDWCRAKGWQVVFLGADFNNSSQAKALGASDANSIGVRSMKLLEAGKELGRKRARNAKAGTDITFTDEEKQTFGGYLGHG